MILLILHARFTGCHLPETLDLMMRPASLNSLR
jgi:hypothetical protein